MKRSRYTLTCEGLDGKTLAFNTANGAFAVLCGEDELPEQFLVADDFDEAAELQRRFSNKRASSDVLYLTLAPTYACNCRCAYCYEQDKATAKSIMSLEVEQALYRFVEQRYADTPFTQVLVEWYGGDPQMCLDVVERISENLIAFCEERAIVYGAMMLSNTTLIGEKEAALLKRCRVNSMLITIDGPESVHNARRPALGVDNAYQRIKQAIRYLQAADIAVNCMMNTDKVNMALLADLEAELGEEFGIQVACAKLNDYAHSYNCSTRFCQPQFDLYTHEEFAHAMFDYLNTHGKLDEATLQGLLTPADNFCSGQLDNSFVIDAFGDVYKCDGWMGDKTRSLFNLLDGVQPTDEISFDPFADECCRACNLLPLCWGNCSWERERCGWPCHPLKHTMADYLRAWQKARQIEI